MKIRKGVAAAFMLSMSLPVMAQEKAQVMLFGTFHFANPGLDTVKTKTINVLTEDNQAYLQALSQRIADKFAPTEVLLECAKGSTDGMNQKFAAYKAGDYQLEVNENYQLGFRIAQLANVSRITCYDEREVSWQAKDLFKEMPESAPHIQSDFDGLIAEVTKGMNDMHKNLSLADVLKEHNAKAWDEKNKYLYIMTNEVGAFDGYQGADASASWWHRNFRMYANVQLAAQPGERVFVLGGQGHTAVMKDFLHLDQQREAVDPVGFF